jgi:hypothetical protein
MKMVFNNQLSIHYLDEYLPTIQRNYIDICKNLRNTEIGNNANAGVCVSDKRMNNHNSYKRLLDDDSYRNDVVANDNTTTTPVNKCNIPNIRIELDLDDNEDDNK